MIKLILMDGDGSTITKDGVVPENLKELIKSRSDLKWIMATGRSLDLLKRTPIVDFLSSNEYHIIDGGATLAKLDGEFKYCKLLTDEEINLIFAKVNADKTNFLYYHHIQSDKKFLWSHATEHRLIDAEDCALMHTDDLNLYKEWVQEFRPAKLVMFVKEHYDFGDAYYHANEKHIDFTHVNVNKASACLDLLTHLNLQAEEVVFVFNDKNDLPIVEHPLLEKIIKIKVGDQLGVEIVADFHAENEFAVAQILEKIMS